MATTEFNFDGLVGPTHNYAGLSHGNVASTKHQHAVSSPKNAALQGLEKMKFVRDLGIGQCVLPPLHRPNLNFLRTLGFSGNDAQLVEKAYATDPVLLAICYSASNMWTANAATVSPAPDTADGRLHLTPANLLSKLHRCLEASDTTRILRAVFNNRQHFLVHEPLPAVAAMSDEGAANHTRLSGEVSKPGLEIFVYGASFFDPDAVRPARFPARQTREAVAALARRHQLDENRYLLVQQNPKAIDAGVFHNDVISVGHENVLLCHEWAFVDQANTIRQIRQRFEAITQTQLYVVEIGNHELPVADAVESYLFNSQIVTRPDGTMSLICPSDCEKIPAARACTEKIIKLDNPISEVYFLDLRQSMNNGGGPACLRLRVALNETQQSLMHQGVVLTDKLYEQLVEWVRHHYRDEICPDDLRDPNLIEETRAAFDELTRILKLPISDRLNAC